MELYTHNGAVRNILQVIQREWHFQVCTVQLVDSHYCVDASKFISILLTCLSTMLHLEMPHVNVLSKIDLIERFGTINFNLDFYTDVLDLSYLLQSFGDSPLSGRYKKLNAAMIELVEDFSLVCFHTLNVDDKHSMASVVNGLGHFYEI